jgi:hypothetical protein
MKDKQVKKGRVTQVTGVVRRDVSGETFLVPIRGRLADLQELFVLNEVGGWLWDRLEHASDFDEVVADLVTEFDVSEQQAREDARKFVEELTVAGLAQEVTDERS